VAAPLQSAFTWRTVGVFIPTIILLCYWTSYSEGVVSSTSFHSLSPPMHIVVALAFLAAVAVPVHRGIQAGRAWAAVLLYVGLVPAVWALGNISQGIPAMIHGARTYPQTPFWLALLVAAVAWPPARAWLRRTPPLSQGELIAVYIMLMVGTLCTSYGVAHFMVPTMTSARYYGRAESKWGQLFMDRIPTWFGPTDATVIDGFWKGDVYQVPWSAWIAPLAAWTLVVLAAVWVMLCLNVLVQRQWIDKERLTFPLVTLPLEISRQERGGYWNAFFRSYFTWAGFAVPVVLHTINGLHQYYPSFPTIQFRHINAMESVQARPWTAMRSLDITFYPCIVGISYLLTLEVSLSTWFFYLVRKLEPVLGDHMGWSEITTPNGFVFPFADHQATGAWMAVVVGALFVSRKELWRVLRQAFSEIASRLRGRRHPRTATRDPQSAEPALSYSTALFGAIAGIAFLVWWLSLAGMTPWVSLTFLGIFFVWCIALTRIRAEAGMGGITGPMTPQETMFLFAGTPVFGLQNLVILQHIKWMTIDLRAIACVMPSQLENLKMGDTMRLEGRSMVWAMLFAILFSTIVAYFILIPIVYQFGGITMNGQRFRQVPTDPFRELTTVLTNPRTPDDVGRWYTGFGFGFTLFLSWMRLHFLWWPFHPLGYAIGFSRRTIDWMWFSIFLGWFLKLVILKTGGMKGYRHALPFFLGMILGEFFMGGVYGFLGVAVPDTRGYQLYP
jgi:hypothetical protein